MHWLLASRVNNEHSAYELHAQQRTSYFCYVVMHDISLLLMEQLVVSVSISFVTPPTFIWDFFVILPPPSISSGFFASTRIILFRCFFCFTSHTMKNKSERIRFFVFGPPVGDNLMDSSDNHIPTPHMVWIWGCPGYLDG